MKTFIKSAVASALVVSFAGLPVIAEANVPLKHDSEYVIDGKIYGMPKAKIYRDDYNGPAVVGDYVTMVPHLAELDYKGNKEHEVRMDVFSQKVEVAPGVSYNAWTFGGSVPGPVLHVREGDRVVFKMKNRSTEEVVITKPFKGASPYFDQIAANQLQKHQPVVAPMPARSVKKRSLSPCSILIMTAQLRKYLMR